MSRYAESLHFSHAGLYCSSRVQRQEPFLCLVHFRGPNTLFLVELNGGRMVRHRHVGRSRAFVCPFFELWVQRRKLLDIVPESFQGSMDGLTRKRFMADEVDVIGLDAGIANDSRRRTGLESGEIVTGNRFLDALFALRG